MPYLQIELRRDDPKARRLARGAVPRRDAHRHRDGLLRGGDRKAVVLALFVPLIIARAATPGSQATSLIIRALALRELAAQATGGASPCASCRRASRSARSWASIGFVRIVLWQQLGWYNYGEHWLLVAITVGTALVGVVTFGSLAGSMLPFLLRRLGFDPASASAPFVATLVDVTGLIIYFSVALFILHGTLL